MDVIKVRKQLSGGKIFTVTFVKKDGSVREMNARLGVKKGVKGVGMSYDPIERGLLPVYDMQKDGFRMINCKTIKKIVHRGEIVFCE
jgi:hypothetical protein